MPVAQLANCQPASERPARPAPLTTQNLDPAGPDGRHAALPPDLLTQSEIKKSDMNQLLSVRYDLMSGDDDR